MVFYDHFLQYSYFFFAGERDSAIEDASVHGSHLTGTELSTTNTSIGNRFKTKRKSIFTNPIDKMLSDRMMNMTPENGKHCDSNNMFYENKNNKCENDYVMTVNNNNIKSERLSPQNGDVPIRNSR